jgi:hypothetical protein
MPPKLYLFVRYFGDSTNVANLQFPGAGEGFEAAVVSFLHVRGETAGGQLLTVQMVTETLTANPLAGTARIRTVTTFHILVLLAFHNFTTPSTFS